MICHEGKVSVIAFIISLSIQLFGVSEYGEKLAILISEIFSSVHYLFMLYFVVLILILTICFKSSDFQVIA
jgi:hypothetical protein